MFLSAVRVAVIVGGAAVLPLAMQAAPPRPVQVQAPPVLEEPDRRVQYEPPVVAAVVDAFRPPSTFAGSGNRGLEYDTVAGQAVVASAEGTVVFAGQVGGSNHVTVRHSDGLRTSYSQLDQIFVRMGDTVAAQQQLGAATVDFHFGVRVGETYLDPAALFGASAAVESRTALLVPVNGS